jgi:hypothetical protein
VIVRVLNDAQYEVSDDVLAQLNELDRQATDALERGDEPAMQQALGEMVEAIRASGTRVADDDLAPSHVVVPPEDFTLDETSRLMSEQGLVPDPPTPDR